MTPLIDVMLVLLVVFMVAAPFLVGAVSVALPKAESPPASPAGASLVVVIDRSGAVLVGDRLLDAAQLSTELARVAASAPDTEIQLRADQAVPYGRVAQFMALAQAAGLGRIGFVTEAPARSPQP